MASSLMIKNERSFVLTRGSQTVGLSERCGESMRHYIVAFDTPGIATKVQRALHPEPILRLERHGIDIDISMDVRERARGALNEKSSTVIVNVSCRLHMQKLKGPKGQVHAKYECNAFGYHMHTMDINDIYMLPFERNVGVVFAQGVPKGEDDWSMVFDCHVIEPCNDTRSLRANLVNRRSRKTT